MSVPMPVDAPDDDEAESAKATGCHDGRAEFAAAAGAVWGPIGRRLTDGMLDIFGGRPWCGLEHEAIEVSLAIACFGL